MELHPNCGQLYADWSVVNTKQNDFGGAIQKLTKARELEPENQDFMKMMSINLVCIGQVDRGVDMMARARARRPAIITSPACSTG